MEVSLFPRGRDISMLWWCGVVWCGVWCGVAWCSVVWRGVAWCGAVRCGVVWCGVSRWSYHATLAELPCIWSALFTGALVTRVVDITLRSSRPWLINLANGHEKSQVVCRTRYQVFCCLTASIVCVLAIAVYVSCDSHVSGKSSRCALCWCIPSAV